MSIILIYKDETRFDYNMILQYCFRRKTRVELMLLYTFRDSIRDELKTF